MGADLQSRALAGLTQGSGRRLLESTGRPVFTIRGHDVEDFVGRRPPVWGGCSWGPRDRRCR
nr:hypothetical protein [Sinorhizobium medicae]